MMSTVKIEDIRILIKDDTIIMTKNDIKMMFLI